MQRFFSASAGLLSAALLIATAGCGGGSGGPFIGKPTVKPSLATISLGGSTPCAQIPCTTTFTVSEAGYNGTFSAASSNTGVATVSVSNSASKQGARRAQDTQATFTVTAVGGGTATITISDQTGNSASIPVTVSSITFTPQLQR